MIKNALIALSLVTSATARGSGSPITATRIDDILNNPHRNIQGNADGILHHHNIPRKISENSIDSILHRTGTKSSYNLFNPTPDALLRDLSPDRPDATESPITVDAGRFAIEASLFDYRRDSGEETFTYGSLNLKAGLTHDVDLQAVIDVRTIEESDSNTLGNLTLRLKWNLYGNDEGESALALMPFITAPTSDGEWEGGLIIPWSTTLTDTIGLGLMAEFDYLHDGEDYNLEFLHTAVLGFSLTEKIGAYTEYIGIITEDHYESFIAGGMNYAVSEHLILDFGVQVGLNADSEDFGFFTGFTKRF